MTILKHSTYFFVAFLLSIVFSPVINLQAQSMITYTDCVVPIPEGENITCGYIQVPEQHNEVDSPLIDVAFLIAHSTSDNPMSDPLLMTNGGPGASTLATFPYFLFEPTLRYIGDQIRSERDIILFEQRGTSYSNPQLFCETAYIETLDLLSGTDTTTDAFTSAIGSCAEDWQGQGINLSAYNSLENARDVTALIDALEYETFNFYGVSYGTTLGQHLMRDYPEYLRSVILDAVAPLDNFAIPQMSQNVEISLQQLFQDCEGCEAELETAFWQTVSDLNETPLIIDLANPLTGEIMADFSLTGNGFATIIMLALYDASIRPQLPTIIMEAKSDVGAMILSQIGGFLLLNRDRADGLYYASLCTEEDVILNDAIFFAGVENFSLVNPSVLSDVCQLLSLPQLPDYVNEAVSSDIPTLLLSGRYDPITPEEWIPSIQENLTSSYAYVFPNGSHGSITNGECSLRIIIEFLAYPNEEPDGSCIG